MPAYREIQSCSDAHSPGGVEASAFIWSAVDSSACMCMEQFSLKPTSFVRFLKMAPSYKDLKFVRKWLKQHMKLNRGGATKEIELFVTKCARQIWSSASAEVQAQLKVGATCLVPGRRHFLSYSMHFCQSAGPSTEKKIGIRPPGTEEKNWLWGSRYGGKKMLLWSQCEEKQSLGGIARSSQAQCDPNSTDAASRQVG